jgi:translocation and assembly module TamA
MRATRIIASLLVFITAPAFANVQYVVTGVDEALRNNVLRHVDTVQFGPEIRLRPSDLERVQAEAVEKTLLALRPFGYYAPDISTRIIDPNADRPTIEIKIDRGPPVRVGRAEIRIVGPGENEALLRAWLADWPLQNGRILNQSTWETQKRDGLDIAATRGYLGAAFEQHVVELDLEQNLANLRLVLNTGQRYVMGDIDFGEHVLKPEILEYVPRFEKGDPYTALLVSRFRTDLWKTGYFTDVNVVEVPRPDQSPPAVDFEVALETERRNRYQGALGWGTDTDIRVQANWSRHPMGSSGGRLDVQAGWQQLDDKLKLRATHRLPRLQRSREYWVTDMTLSFDNLDLEVKESPEDEGFIQIATGDIDERHLRFGRLKVSNMESGEHQLFRTPFIQYLNTESRFRLNPDLVAGQPGPRDPELDRLLKRVDNAFSIGMDYDLVAVEGRAYETQGYRDRAWIFHSDKAFGSEVEFTQLYASTRRSYLIGDRFKAHVRGEVGYTDANVSEFDLVVGGTPLELSVTELPSFYRFKAGGSMSVRGYGFEQLSDNDIGSNHIITASAELEYRFLNTWSAAVYADIGNAFNDWSNPDLKRGLGFGIRWYSIAGEVRVDYARAIDFNGRPWRLHITIGTPLL